jgi:hypothetical protein
MIEEYVKKHADSNNPQTELNQFDTEEIIAVPNLYEAVDNVDVWKKFYDLIKDKKEYKLVDEAVNAILTIHNKKARSFQ